MSTPFDKQRVIDLVGRLCDQEINQDELAELEDLLEQYAEARQVYHLAVAVHRDLGSCDITDVQTSESSAVAVPVHKPPRTTSWIALVVTACLLAAISLLVFQWYGGRPVTLPPTVATVTDLVDAQWGDDQLAMSLGDDVSAGRLQIAGGTVCLTFQHGVVMTVEGPADLGISDQDHVVLHDGQMVAYVPDGAEGFTVTTDTATIVDLGTEFAVATRQDGSSEVIVFDGEVELAAANASQAETQRVVAGLAYRVDRSGKSHQEKFRQSAFEDARSLIRERRVIRDTFRSDTLFPGTKRNGWTGPWEFATANLSIDEQATGIRAEAPLFPATRNYLTVATTATETEPGTLMLGRGFDSFNLFDATQPYTVEFCLRLESPTDSLRGIRIVGTTAGQNEAGWMLETSTSADAETLHWQITEPRSRTDRLPIVSGRSYRFSINVNPRRGLWRVSISDGQRPIWNGLHRMQPLGMLKDSPQTKRLVWQFDVAPESKLQFSMDAVRIQNNPTGDGDTSSRRQ